MINLKSIMAQLLQDTPSSLCVACLQPGARLCHICQGFLVYRKERCRLCGLPLVWGSLCGPCRIEGDDPASLDGVITAWDFNDLARFLIHQFKYHQDRAAGQALASHWFEQIEHLPKVDALMAAPMHHRKQVQRGFNQAQLLANEWAQRLNCPLYTGVRKINPSQALTGLNRRQRQQALKHCFQLMSPPPAQVAIIDDVITTGSTAATLCQLLKNHGCKTVYLWSLAKTA